MRRNSFISALIQQCSMTCPTIRNAAPSCAAPSLYAPTPMPTFPSPTHQPTVVVLRRIAVVLSFVLAGVSASSWAVNEALFDATMVQAIVTTISNSAIQSDQIEVYFFELPSLRRLVEESSESDRIEITANVRADNVLGLSDASLIRLMEDAVADGTFTKKLQEASHFYGASDLYDVTVLSVSGRGEEKPSSNHETNGVRPEVIVAIVLAAAFVLLITALTYMYGLDTIRRYKRKLQRKNANGSSTHPERALVEPTQNPLHPGKERSDTATEARIESATVFHGKL